MYGIIRDANFLASQLCTRNYNLETKHLSSLRVRSWTFSTNNLYLLCATITLSCFKSNRKIIRGDQIIKKKHYDETRLLIVSQRNGLIFSSFVDKRKNCFFDTSLKILQSDVHIQYPFHREKG